MLWLKWKTAIATSITLALSNTVHAVISDELHKKCLEARDYAGCVNTNKKFSREKYKKFWVGMPFS